MGKPIASSLSPIDLSAPCEKILHSATIIARNAMTISAITTIITTITMVTTKSIATTMVVITTRFTLIVGHIAATLCRQYMAGNC